MALLFNPGDSDELRECIRKLAGDPALRASIAKKGQEYALSLGDEDRLARELQQRSIELCQ